MATVRVRIIGMDALIRKLGPDLVADPARRFLDRWAIKTQSVARTESPVDRGRLRNSIAKEIDSAHVPRFARVGTNVVYGPFVHDGSRPHFPPPAALDGWARRHGFGPGGGFMVARAISRRGTRPRPFLRFATDKTARDIPGLVEVMAREIESAASI